MKEKLKTFSVVFNIISLNLRKIKNQKKAKYSLRSSNISCLYCLYFADNITATSAMLDYGESYTLKIIAHNYSYCNEQFVLLEKGLKAEVRYPRYLKNELTLTAGL